MLTKALDEQRFLSEIKQPRGLEETRYILCHEIDNGTPLSVVGTNAGNMLLYGGLYPMGMVRYDNVNEKFDVILRHAMPDVLRADMLEWLKKQFPDAVIDDDFLVSMLTDPRWGGN